MDADFVDLILWILIPLLILFALWAIQDCLRERGQSRGIRLTFVILILLLPIWGGVLWFRFKEKQAAQESPLMARVRRRRGGS